MRRRYQYWLAATVRCPYCLAKNALPEQLNGYDVFECFHCGKNLAVLFFYTLVEELEGLDKEDYGEKPISGEPATIQSGG